jgi:hypothetical protein
MGGMGFSVLGSRIVMETSLKEGAERFKGKMKRGKGARERGG